MDLLQNPFHILNATPRDNRRRIVELSEEQSLLPDSGDCTQARSDLTNPRKRLLMEIAWLPGLGPKRVAEVLSMLENSTSELLGLDNLTPTARANLLAAGLSRLDVRTSSDIVDWLLGLACAFEEIDPERLRIIINEERIVSGFPEVTDLSMVEDGIEERRHHYLQVIKSALDCLPTVELVKAVTTVVEQDMILINDLIHFYEVEAQVFLEREMQNARTLVDKLKTAADDGQPDSVLRAIVDRLIQVVKNWDAVAQPIQVSTKKHGLDHEASQSLARLIRDAAIHLNNEHGRLDISQELTHMLQEVFAEVIKIAESAAEDASTLESIAEQRARKRDEMTFEASIGILGTIKICPEGIEWGSQYWSFDTITRIRWGVTRNYIGTSYKIIVGDDNHYSTIEIGNQYVFNQIIERLWKAVGVRLLISFLDGLRDGKRYRFGNAIVSDLGIELERRKPFFGIQSVFCHWKRLSIAPGSEDFNIAKKDDVRFTASFSYLKDDNTHVLEAAIRMLFKHGGDKLSSLLGEQ